MYSQASKIYRRVSVASASPAQVLDELYGRLIRDCRDAASAIEQKDIPGKHAAVNHAIAIVTELEAALDDGAAPDLCGNLRQLYLYCQDELLTASRELNAVPLGRVQSVVGTLREAFAQVARGHK